MNKAVFLKNITPMSLVIMYLIGYSPHSMAHEDFTSKFNDNYTLAGLEALDEQPYNRPSIAVIGTGYVGLITGACLAKFGNKVTCVDIDIAKIKNLNNNIMPIYEPGLSEVVSASVRSKKLSFSYNVSESIQGADVIFIAVNTPMGDDGSADLSAFKSVIWSISKNLNNHKIIVNKSTVPIGTGAWVKKTFEEYGIDASQYDVISNPEFLREGSAVNDFLLPDRIVLGSDSEQALETMKQVYSYLLEQNVPCVCTNIVTAESIKYACNAFLATKLSFINELANLADQTGANIKDISYAMGLDSRISKYFLNPGPGFGGSCFPKDTQALIYTAQQHGVNLNTVHAAYLANETQKIVPVTKLSKLMNNDLAGKTIAILGLAFKGNTDDVRYSPAITTIKLLLARGAYVKAYDPQAMTNMREYFANITYCRNIQEAVENADAIVVMTEWDEFREMDLADIALRMRNRVLVDARNILDTNELTQLGFTFDTIGRSYLSNLPANVIKRRFRQLFA